jgi:hypothetical protein
MLKREKISIATVSDYDSQLSESGPTSILILHYCTEVRFIQMFSVCCFLRDEKEVGHLVLVQQVLVKETRQRRDKVRGQGDFVVLYLFQLPASAIQNYKISLQIIQL